MQAEKSIQHAIDELKVAKELYDQAHKASQAASSQETDALNRLNQAQKNFDKAVDEIKTDSPHRSDWHPKNWQRCKES